MKVFDRWFTALLLTVLSFFIGVALARAEPYVAGDLLWTTYQGPRVDGTWTQEHLESQRGIPAVRQTKESLTWDVGAGYRFANGESWLSQHWSITRHFAHP